VSVTFFQDDTHNERTVGAFQLALADRVPSTRYSDLTTTLTVTATVPLNATVTVIQCVSEARRRELELMVNDVTLYYKNKNIKNVTICRE